MSLNAFHVCCPITSRAVCYCKGYATTTTTSAAASVHQENNDKYSRTVKMIYQMYTQSEQGAKYVELLRDLSEADDESAVDDGVSVRLDRRISFPASIMHRIIQQHHAQKQQQHMRQKQQQQQHAAAVGEERPHQQHQVLPFLQAQQQQQQQRLVTTGSETAAHEMAPLAQHRLLGTPSTFTLPIQGGMSVMRTPSQDNIITSSSSSSPQLQLFNVLGTPATPSTPLASVSRQRRRGGLGLDATPASTASTSATATSSGSGSSAGSGAGAGAPMQFVISNVDKFGNKKRGRPAKKPYCGECNKDTQVHEMIQCQKCHMITHTFCHEPDLKHLKDEHRKSWVCQDCKVCEVCDTEGNEGKVLICEVCDQAYHTYCLDPPLTSVPADLWVCPRCQGVPVIKKPPPLLQQQQQLSSSSSEQVGNDDDNAEEGTAGLGRGKRRRIQ